MSAEHWRCSAASLSRQYGSGELTPEAAVQAVLARIAEVNPRLNAIVALDTEAALAAARASGERWRRGTPLSPLDGVPFTVKDNIAAAGLPCTWGSPLYRDWVPMRDELPVARLRAAGAVVLGKTNVPEFTLHGFTANALFGVTRNPWNAALTPGGSSGGAVAAVASGCGPLALATDGGGSIRRPAGHTGLVGLKPTARRVARRHGLPALLQDFEVVGPIARRVQDLQWAMRVLDPGFAQAALPPTPPPVLRILHVRAIANSPVDPLITAALETVAQQLRALGHTVVAQDDLALADTVNREVWPVVSGAGLAWVLQRFPDAEAQLAPALQPMRLSGAALCGTAVLQALDVARQAREALEDLQREWDLLLLPTAAAMPWPAAQTHPETIGTAPVGPRGHAVFTAFANATGVPALALPGPRLHGLPIGFQLVGRAGDDELLCAVGAAYEAAWPWAHGWPPLD